MKSRVLADYWPMIDSLIAHARGDPAFQDLLYYGTPDQKLEALGRHGLTFEDLVFIYHELQGIFFPDALKFWWW